MKYFKGDATELKFYNAFLGIVSGIEASENDFYTNGYSAAPLGDAIYEANKSPLTNVITKEIFRIAFNEIFDAFIAVGTAEAYLTVFRKIFGDSVEVEFVVPGPGQLDINIEALELELVNLAVREIVEDNYVLYDLITQDGLDEIMLQSVVGIDSQYELENMLREMVPQGIFTQISLTIGS